MTATSECLTDLSKYNDSEFVGIWRGFPTTKGELVQAFDKIGVDSVKNCLIEPAKIDTLNYFASKLEGMGRNDLEKYKEIIETGNYSGSIEELIYLVENLHCFDYIKGAVNDYDIGHYWVNKSGYYDSKNISRLSNYIDYERLGRDIRFVEGGTFTANGYIKKQE